LASELIGKDPQDPSIVPHPNGLSDSHDAAAAGIDNALWDLKGKIAGKRTSELLADEPLDRLRLYASSGCRYDWRYNPRQLIEEALEYIDAGYKAMKFRPGSAWEWDGVTVDRFLGLMRELVQEVDGRMGLMLDAIALFSEDQAMAIAKELDRLGFTWFEEPLSRDQIDGYARLCAAVDMPISGGEVLTTLEQFKPWLEKGAYDIVQPDANLCGITEAMRIGKAAYRNGAELVPHSWHNGLGEMANAHVAAALPQGKWLELNVIQGPLQWAILKEKPTIEDGWLVLPDKPGLGVELADDLEERFPYIEGSYLVRVRR
jgi:L-alanine-DL-glutamate epimerase-like enolase superfamily enzyme